MPSGAQGCGEGKEPHSLSDQVSYVALWCPLLETARSAAARCGLCCGSSFAPVHVVWVACDMYVGVCVVCMWAFHDRFTQLWGTCDHHSRGQGTGASQLR